MPSDIEGGFTSANLEEDDHLVVHNDDNLKSDMDQSSSGAANFYHSIFQVRNFVNSFK
jgi:hypothetical protein